MHLLRRIISFAAILAGLFVPVALYAATGTIDAANYKARLCQDTTCTTYSVVYWKTTNGPAVSITDSGLSGYIWSENLGWINLAPTEGGVDNTTGGVLSGYGWGDTASWVNFDPTHGGVTINTTTGEFSGYAWISNAGWMRFDCSLADACVETDWRPTVGTTTGTSGTTGGHGPGPGSGTTTGTGTTATGTTTTGTGTTTTGTGTTGATTTGTTGTTTGAGTTTGGTTGGTTTTGTTTTGTTTGTTTTGTTGEGTTGTTTGTGTTGGNTGTTGTGTSTGGGTTGGGVIITDGGNGCPPSTATDPIDIIKDQIKTSYCETVDTIKDTGAKIKKIFASDAGNKTAQIIATVGVIVAATAAIISGLFLNPLSFSEIFLIPARLWSLLMGALGLRKRKQPWGTVYDSVTKQPLDPAYVTLKTLEGEDVVASLTDLDGRFGFVVPKPGTYSIFAQKTNYVFPSQKLVGQDHDELYRDLYFGEHFAVENAGDVVIKNIPMDPEKFDWNEFAKKDQNLMKFYSKRGKIIHRLSDIFFGIGFSIAALAAIFAPRPYNVLLFALYVILFFIRTFGKNSRPYGDITDAKTGAALSFALIRISNIATGVEVMHRIADKEGRYYALLPNGNYNIRIDRKLPDGKYETVVTGLPAAVTKGYLSSKFSV
jgi:hypothetical protein